MSMNRLCHVFFLLIPLVLAGCVPASTVSKTDQAVPLFSFGVVADAQYADKDPAGLRHYRSSLTSLEAAAEAFNGSDLAFVVHLGISSTKTLPATTTFSPFSIESGRLDTSYWATTSFRLRRLKKARLFLGWAWNSVISISSSKGGDLLR